MPSPTSSPIWAAAPGKCGGIFDFDSKQSRLIEVERQLEDPGIWSDAQRAQELGREKKSLDGVVGSLTLLDSQLRDAGELFEMAHAENDDATLASVADDLAAAEKLVAQMEFRRMFSNALDPNNCFLDIQSGSGGTEAQDWAAMLERMYIKYCEKNGFDIEVLEQSEGEVAGIKSATLKIRGEYAYGRLRTETGIHRLVRKSPFDSGNRRHTSFASVFAYPEVDDTIEVEINPADLRIDTYRASGAGGQHINKTDSAVRITHLPTGVVVECQDGRSQHQNKAQAMRVLAARIKDTQVREHNAKTAATRKNLVGSGDRSERIRTYNFPQGRVTDHRINLTLYKMDSIMDGDIGELTSALMAEHQAEQLAAMAEDALN